MAMTDRQEHKFVRLLRYLCISTAAYLLFDTLVWFFETCFWCQIFHWITGWIITYVLFRIYLVVYRIDKNEKNEE